MFWNYFLVSVVALNLCRGAEKLIRGDSRFQSGNAVDDGHCDYSKAKGDQYGFNGGHVFYGVWL